MEICNASSGRIKRKKKKAKVKANVMTNVMKCSASWLLDSACACAWNNKCR